MFTDNVEFLKLVKFLKTGKWLGTEVQFDAPDKKATQGISEQQTEEQDSKTEAEEDIAKRVAGVSGVLEEKIAQVIEPNRKVFIKPREEQRGRLATERAPHVWTIRSSGLG